MAKEKQEQEQSKPIEDTKATAKTPTQAQAQPEVTKELVEVPDGFELSADELVGIWGGEGQVIVRPVGYTLSDSKAFDGNAPKPQAMIHCIVLRRVRVIQTGHSGTPVQLIEVSKGERIGIWYKPGLRDMLKWNGTPLCVTYKGERDVGRGTPMKVYAVANKTGCSKADVPLIEDYRRFTRLEPLPWEGKSRTSGNTSSGGEYDYFDDYDRAL